MVDDPTNDTAYVEARRPTSAEQDILNAQVSNFPGSTGAPLVIGGVSIRNPNDLEAARHAAEAAADRRAEAFKDSYYNKRDPTLVTNASTGVGAPDTRQQFSSQLDAQVNSTGQRLGPGQVAVSQRGSLTGGGLQNEYGRSSSYNQALQSQVTSTQQGQLPAGEQAIIQGGTGARNSGQFIDQMKGQPFNPGRLVSPDTNKPYLEKPVSAVDANQNFTPYKPDENTYKGKQPTNTNDTNTTSLVSKNNLEGNVDVNLNNLLPKKQSANNLTSKSGSRSGELNSVVGSSIRNPEANGRTPLLGRTFATAASETGKELTLGPLGYVGQKLSKSEVVKSFSEGLGETLFSPIKGINEIFAQTSQIPIGPATVLFIPKGADLIAKENTAQKLIANPDVQNAGFLAVGALATEAYPIVGKIGAYVGGVIGVKDFVGNPTAVQAGQSAVLLTPALALGAERVSLSRQSSALSEELSGQVASGENLKSLLDVGAGRRTEVTGQVVTGVEYQGTSRTVGGVGGVAPGKGIIPGGIGTDIVRRDPGLRGASFSTDIPLGVRTSEIKGVPLFEERTASPEDIPDKFLVEGSTRRVVTRGPTSQTPGDALSDVFGVSGQGEERFAFTATPNQVNNLLPALGNEVKSGAAISGSDVNLIKPLTVSRTEVVPAPSGFTSNEAAITNVRFFAVPKDVNVPTPDKNFVFDFTLKQIPEGQGQVASSFRAPGEIENLRPFSVEAGDYYAINPSTGQFGIVRSTEARRFVLGTGEIPGRETFSSGFLPGAVGNQKNLPPELLTDFLNTPKGKAFLAQQNINGPFIIQKVKVLKANPTTGQVLGEITAADAAAGQLTSQGQILLQVPKQSTASQAMAAQEQVVQSQAQEEQSISKQQGQVSSGKQQSAPLSQSRFPDIGQRQAAQFKEFREVVTGRKLAAQQNQRLAIIGGRTVLRDTGLLQGQQLKDLRVVQPSQAQTSSQLFDTRQATAQRQRFDQLSAQDVIQLPKQTTVQEQATDFRSKSDLFDVTKTKNKLPTPVPVILKPSQGSNTGNRFGVEVRKGGRFQRQSVSSDLLGAIYSGKKEVQNTAAASFRVVDLRTGQPLDLTNELDVAGPNFNTSKRNKTVLVQKRSNRISSAGEKQQITMKGIQASRAKSRRGLFGRMNGGRL